MLMGVPVNPCTSSTPVRPSGPSPPGKANGSAPGMTAVGAVGSATELLLGVRRRGRPAGRVSGTSLGAADCRSHGRVLSLAVPEGGVLFYWFLKFVAIGPAVHAVYRPRAEGTENGPATGGGGPAGTHPSGAGVVLLPPP